MTNQIDIKRVFKGVSMRFLFWILLIICSVSGKIRHIDIWDSTETVSRNLKNLWIFDQYDSTTYDMIGGNTVTLTGTGPVAWVDSGVLKGGANYYHLTSSISLTGRFTVAFRYIADSLPNDFDALFGDYSNAGWAFVGIGYGSNLYRVRNDAGTNSDINSAGMTYSGWKTIVIMSKTPDSLVLYDNGVKFGRWPVNNLWTGTMTFDDIGHGVAGETTYGLKGKLSWFSYWSDTLSMSDVQAISTDPFSDFTQATLYYVISEDGQSNISSRGASPYTKAPVGGAFCWYANTFNRVFDPWNYYEISESRGGVGPVLNKTLRTLRPTISIMNLPTGKGACGLTYSQSPSGYFWTDRECEMYLESAAKIDSQHVKPHIKLYWGSESDIIQGISQSRYHDSLASYITNWREVDSTMRFVIPIPYYGGYDNTNVKNATYDVRSEIQGVFIPFEVYPTFSSYLVENVHYTCQGYDSIGARLARWLDSNGLVIEPIIDSFANKIFTIAGGESIRIRGRNFFTALDDGATLTIGDSSITEATTFNDTTIVFVNKGYVSRGVHNLVITNVKGFKDTSQVTFGIADSLRPLNQYVTRLIDLYGYGFGSAGRLLIGATNVTSPLAWTNTHITDTIPSSVARGTYAVRIVTSTNDTITSADSLRVFKLRIK